MKDSMVRRSRIAKWQAAVAKRAIELAREKNDPLYKKYETYHMRWQEYKQKLVDKYMQRARNDVKR